MDGVASATSTPSPSGATGTTAFNHSEDGRMATIDVVLEGDPFTKDALNVDPGDS